MGLPVATLLETNLKSWVSARGFWMILLAALVPTILTGAWVVTHQADVSAERLSWDPDPAQNQDNMTFTAVILNKGHLAAPAFNATIGVGTIAQDGLRVLQSKTHNLAGLGAGESTTITFTWRATTGLYGAYVIVDEKDAVPEIEEFNNVKALPFIVNNRAPADDTRPATPGNLTSPSHATPADLRFDEITFDPAQLKPDGTPVFTARVTNLGPSRVEDASVNIRVGQSFSGTFFPFDQQAQNVSLDPGASTTVNFTWTSPNNGGYWVDAVINTTGVAHEANTTNNHLARAFAINPVLPTDVEPPAIPERLTIKQFYLEILQFLHLSLLLPFIALFYAGGTISDERSRGNLVYILTRPIPRWLIPLTKFASGYLVASLAVLAGVLSTFLLLFGFTPEGDLGFLTTPLLASLLALFVYGAFFTLLGVLVDRPYLIGIAFVIGWEVIAPNFTPWVRNLTLNHHLLKALTDWRLDEGLQWLPATSTGLDALRNILLAALGFLALAAIVMFRREFDD
jgi:hypothetical protein